MYILHIYFVVLKIAIKILNKLKKHRTCTYIIYFDTKKFFV